MSTDTQATGRTDGVAETGANTLSVTDNRTGRTYEIDITDGTVRAMDFRQIKVDDDDFGLMTYDPAFTNTAAARSAITYIDGDAGILEYRGYPIEQLAEQSTFIEVAYLLVHGELPTQKQLDEWTHEITIHTFVHENVKDFMQGLPARRPSDGHAARLRRRPLDLLPGREQDQGRGQPPPADDPADREDADARGLRLPPLAGHAVRLSGQRPAVPGQLPEHDVQDDRAEVRAGPPARAGARHPVHPPRRPRAERLDERGPRRRLDPGRPVLGDRRRRRRPLRPAARRRQRGRAADAPAHRDEGQHPRLHRRA